MIPASESLRTDIFEEHLEEIAFLWSMRNSAVIGHNYDLNDLYELGNRISAHIDGFGLSMDAAWPLLADVLNHGDADEVFSATITASSNKTVSFL